MLRRPLILRSLVASATLATLIVAASGAKADPVVDFHVKVPGNTGSVTYAGGAAPLVGNNIQLDFLYGSGTPQNDGDVTGQTLSLSGGLLNFTTGNLTSSQSSTLDFAPGGTINITGGISDLGIGSGTTLLQGTIESAQIVPGRIIIQTFINSLNGVVGSFFGLPIGTVGPNGLGSFPYLGALNLSFNVGSTDPTKAAGNFVGKPLSGDVTTTPTPEPGTLALACVGVLLASGYGWRKSSRGRLAA